MSTNFMDNKVYYGEYSLKHWVTLILKKNIILPEYQRYFVWDKNKTKELIKAFQEKQFVPPVTIGSFKDNGKNVNLILDGQQRLTSILLAYIERFPDKKCFENKNEIGFVDENDNPLEYNELANNILEWNFNKLIEKGDSKNQILANIEKGRYQYFNCGVNDDFFNDTFLGFSYIVPEIVDNKAQQRFYSKVFRSINVQGELLLPQESRAALYYLDKDLEKYFIPEFIDKIIVNDKRIDFVRFVALLSQFEKDGTADKLAKGFARNLEKYYEEYIYFIVGEEKSDLFIANKMDFKESFKRLNKDLSELQLFKKYDSIIDIDIALFGLIYFTVIKDKDICVNEKCKIVGLIDDKIKEFKNNELHKKNPSAFKHLRLRVRSSIDIYKDFVI